MKALIIVVILGGVGTMAMGSLSKGVVEVKAHNDRIEQALEAAK